MAWLPQLQQHYYNPTTNRIPTSILENHLRYALEEADTNDFEGIDTARYDDVPSNWDTLKLQTITVAVQPIQMMTLAEKAEKLKELRARKKAEK